MPSNIQPPASLVIQKKLPLPVIAGIVISLAILILSKLGTLQPVNTLFSGIYSIFLPAQTAVVDQLTRPVRWVQYMRHGEAQIKTLEQQLAERTTQVAEAEFLQKENQELRQQLEAFSTQDVREQQSVLTVPARVVTAGGIIGIDQGQAAGLQVGDVVFSRGYVIGRLNKVDQFFAHFSLINQGNTPVVVKTLKGVVGVLTGQENQLILTEVAVDQSIELGERLYTVGSVDQGIPPGLIVGEVGAVTQRPQSSTKDIHVSQPGNDSLPSLVVIRRYEGK